MSETFTKIISNAEEQLQIISLEIEDTIKRSEASIELILVALEQLKAVVINEKFNQTEEIKFFKETKPQLLSKLIYHNKVYKIEMKKPQGGDKVLRKYYNIELDKLKRYFDYELEFYRYYRSNSTYLDHKYFVRGKHDIKLSLDTFYFEADHRFTTTHDYKVAKIIANDQIQVYLESELFNLERKQNSHQKAQVVPKIKITWTANKTALIELIYGLHTQDAFDNGKADIKQIAEYFETIFNIDLGDYYRSYLEMRNRKANPTKFLDSMKENLLKRMEETEIR